MRNDRLREAMAAAGLSDDALAHAVGVDPKSVWRWLNKGVVPRRVDLKPKIAKVLGVSPADIWPAPAEVETEDEAEATEEIVRAWSHRADVPKARWWAMFSHASEYIDLLGYAMQFLPEDHARLDRLLIDKAKSGCSICASSAERPLTAASCFDPL